MAAVVWAALVQGALTLGAAYIAVQGVGRQIGNWRHEVPGRRKIEIAEDCMIAALAQQRLVKQYSAAIRDGMTLQLNPRLITERLLEHEDEALFWERIEDAIDLQVKEVREGLTNLEHHSEIAEVYFNEPIRGAFSKMRDAGQLISYRHRQFLETSSPEDRQQHFEWLNLPFTAGSTVTAQEDVSIALYRAVLRSTIVPSYKSPNFLVELRERICQRIHPRAMWALDRWLPRR
jgi:hypothetical protein